MILKTISLSQALPSDNGFDLKYEGKKKTNKQQKLVCSTFEAIF